MLLVGDPAALPQIPGEPPLPRLSGAGEEVRAIARLRGADKAAALRAAQLSLIHRLRAGEIKVTLPIGTFMLPEDPAFWRRSSCWVSQTSLEPGAGTV